MKTDALNILTNASQVLDIPSIAQVSRLCPWSSNLCFHKNLLRCCTDILRSFQQILIYRIEIDANCFDKVSYRRHKRDA